MEGGIVLTGILLLSHGRFCEGIIEGVEMFMGEVEKLECLKLCSDFTGPERGNPLQCGGILAASAFGGVRYGGKPSNGSGSTGVTRGYAGTGAGRTLYKSGDGWNRKC